MNTVDRIEVLKMIRNAFTSLHYNVDYTVDMEAALDKSIRDLATAIEALENEQD